jgi:hypothetical protein
MWFGKDAKPATGAPRKEIKEIHVAHTVETLVGDFLIKHGRLEKRRTGRHLLQFIGANHNNDGSTDYTVRTRVHTSNGMERNFESTVRIDSKGSLTLVR